MKSLKKIEELFRNWDETIIWSCLDGIMGEIYTNSPKDDAAMAILGDFAFYIGNPSEDLLKFKPESCKQDFIIMVPQNDKWASLIEKCYGKNAKKVTRYAIKKEKDIFDKEKLQKAVSELPEGYELKLMGEEEYMLCKKDIWSKDLVSQFSDFNSY